MTNKPFLFKINFIDFIISTKLLVCAKKLLATIKLNLEYLLTIFLARLKSSGFLIVSTPFFFLIFVVFFGSTPNTLKSFFLLSLKKNHHYFQYQEF